jgi:hypothetical protein
VEPLTALLTKGGLLALLANIIQMTNEVTVYIIFIKKYYNTDPRNSFFQFICIRNNKLESLSL